jgi:REP element-mobilizing transposase RayT
VRQLKSKSGYACLQQIGKHGNFWQHESYDHVVRNEKEFERIITYVIENPVKAGLVEEWHLCPYTYVNPDLL